jgi:RecB family exonuclease
MNKLLFKERNAIKPDRIVVVKNNEVFLLDYKTGIHNAKYQQQLENYQKQLS